MIGIIVAITCFSLAVPIYVYIGYPLLLVILNRLMTGKGINKHDITPSVTLIVSCYNEKKIIEHKIINCLAIDYPSDLLDFVFVSDGSDDGTDDVIQQFSSKRVTLVQQQGRLGKTMELNLAVPRVTGDFIVFSEANAMYQEITIQMLVRNFNDDEVGYVVGAALSKDETKASAGSSENTYWRYEIFLKEIESKLHSVVGGECAIYAIRKQLYERLDPEDINDFVNPLQIVARGFRGVFEVEAVCFEQTAGDFEKEARRKQRIVNRSFNGLLKNRVVLNPFKFGFFSLELISHKLLRWLVPFFIIIASLGVFTLARSEIFVFQICFLLDILFIWSAMLGKLLKNRPTTPLIFLYPYYSYLVNINSLIGVLKSLGGNVQVTWSTQRHSHDIGETKSFMPILFNLSLLLVTNMLFAETLHSVI